MSSSKFDIVVYGATGFTGQLVAEYLAAHYKGDATLKWAMAGRSKDKLASVRDAIGAPADTPLIVADASDPASLKAMVGQTKSIISTVGPYQLYGSDLVAACAASGTDYFDLCGEPVWMRRMIEAHEATAKSNGARIVFSCGFDSLPFELGVFCAQEEAKKVFGAPANRVKGRVRDMRGTFSGGTAASMRATFAAAANDPSMVALLRSSVRADAGFRRPETAAGQPAGVRRGTRLLDHAVCDGNHQHPQRSSLESPDGLSLRQGFCLRRDDADRSRREGRGQSQAYRHANTEKMGSGGRSRARDRRRRNARTASTICCSWRSPPMAVRAARWSRATAIPAMARPRR